MRIKSLFFISITLLILLFTMGCSPKCPASCDDGSKCTEDYCSAETNFKCIHNEIEPCCGNHLCESDEDFKSCYADCNIDKEGCTEFKIKINENDKYGSFLYKYYYKECKNVQILQCKDLDMLNLELESIKYRKYRDICLLNMAFKYQDPDICDYISAIREYDSYWYCSAILEYGKSACSNINGRTLLNKCLSETY